MNRSSALTLAALAALTTSASAAVAIDPIQADTDPGTDDTFALSSGNSTPASVTQTLTDGTTRTATVVRDGGFGQTITATLAPGSGVVDVQNGNVSAGDFSLAYSGFADGNFADDSSRIDVDVPSITTAVGDSEFDGFLTIDSAAGSGTASTGRIEASVTGGATTLSFAYANPAFASVDFSAVTGVTLRLDTAIIGSDFQVGSIVRDGTPLVPEPAAAALLALGGLALLRRR